MTGTTWDRLAAAAGMVSVIFFVVGAIVYGSPPDVSDSARTISAFFVDNRDQVLWGVFLQGLGVLALIWFTAALVIAMREEGELRLGTALTISFSVALMLGSMAALLRAGLAFTIAEDAAPQTVANFFNLSSLVDTSQNVISAGIFLSVGGAVIRTRFLPVWFGWLSLVSGLFAVVSATAWNRDGFWSPDGAGFANFVIYVVWVGLTSLLLTMKIMRRTGVT